jgi:hypothetical protein
MPILTYREWFAGALPSASGTLVHVFHLQHPDLSQDLQEKIGALRHGHKIVLWVDFAKPASPRLRRFLTQGRRGVRVMARSAKIKAFHVQRGLFWGGPWSSYVLENPTSEAPPLQYWLP